MNAIKMVQQCGLRQTMEYGMYRNCMICHAECVSTAGAYSELCGLCNIRLELSHEQDCMKLVTSWRRCTCQEAATNDVTI
jgi:hypothetical protein